MPSGGQQTPLLSVVAVTRNDDHGGDLRGRTQHFINGFIAQCRRHQLAAELILVDWNPPQDRPSLEEALHWPTDFGPAQVRIVTVPPEIHATHSYADALPLFQMIGKNVGIRRSRGKYILATNIDILLSDELVRYLRDKLSPGVMLRVDRYDVPSDLPTGVPFEQVLSICDMSFFQVNTRFGTYDVKQKLLRGVDFGPYTMFLSFIVGWRILGNQTLLSRPVSPRAALSIAKLAAQLGIVLAANASRGISRRLRRIDIVRPWRIPAQTFRFGRRMTDTGVRHCRRVVKAARSVATLLAEILGVLPQTARHVVLYHRARWLHTNACGDFTLLARDDWFRLRGYPDWPIFSWQLDSVFMYAANANGVVQVALGPRHRIYHIDHGSGWSLEGASQLFSRLDGKGIPYLRNNDLDRLNATWADDPHSAVVNGPNWGLAEHQLPERWILPMGRKIEIQNIVPA